MIYARVVAKPVNFPEELDIRYETLDRETGENVAVFGSQRSFSWEEVKRKFSIGDARAIECERQLRQRETALIAQAQEWESDWNPTETTFGTTCITSVTYVRRSH
jgi:phage-related minor tail protein